MKPKKLLIVKNSITEGPGIIETILKEKFISYDIADLDKGNLFPSAEDYSAVIVLGGPDSANDSTVKMNHELARIREAIGSDTPYLGICLGMQALVKAAGGNVFKNPVKEIGVKHNDGKYYEIELTDGGKNDPMFRGMDSRLKIFQLHGETIGLAEGMQLLAAGKHCANQAVKVGKNAYGIQGHLELTEKMFNEWIVTDSDLKKLDRQRLISDFDSAKKEYENNGRKLIGNFLENIFVVKPN
ncbi:type 1 glutamine amidotransferase [Candidatus Woesearchaeota archaeon]|nr:type 1 glutamine amidotransferase [Candidatus Woesearchaeota archaeon]